MAENPLIKACRDKLQLVEKRLKSMEESIGLIVRGTIGYREKLSHFVTDLSQHADESVGTMKACLTDVTRQFQSVDEELDKLDNRLQAVILGAPRGFYKRIEEMSKMVKRLETATSRCDKKRQAVERLETAPNKDRSRIGAASSELEGAKAELQRTEEEFDAAMLEFERERVKLMKKLLKEFSHAQLMYHAKALESFTTMWNVAAGFSIDAAAVEHATGYTKKRPSLSSIPRQGSSLTGSGRSRSSAGGSGPLDGSLAPEGQSDDDDDDDDDEDDNDNGYYDEDGQKVGDEGSMGTPQVTGAGPEDNNIHGTEQAAGQPHRTGGSSASLRSPS